MTSPMEIALRDYFPVISTNSNPEKDLSKNGAVKITNKLEATVNGEESYLKIRNFQPLTTF